MTAPNIEIIADDNNLCGEGPLWDGARGRLLWVDLRDSLVFEYQAATGTMTILSRRLMVASIATHQDGRLVFAGSTGLHIWSEQDSYQTVVAEHDGEKLYFNDMIADAAGRIYAGTSYWGANGMEKLGKLYLIGNDAAIQVVDEGIELSNGLGFSPDNRTLYYADSVARRIYAYDADARNGALSRKRVFVQIPGQEGIPDGLTVDAEGYVWCAQWYGGQVVRYDPEGHVERRIAIPAKQTSCVAFGGHDLTDLYVTSAAQPWPSKLTPPGYDSKTGGIGGALYRVRTEIQGRPEHATNI